LSKAAPAGFGGQKEGDQQGFLDDERTLMFFVGLRKAQEHQEQTKECHRMVSKQHYTCEQDEMH